MLWDKFLAAFLVLGAPAAMCFPLSTPAAVDPNVLGVNGTNTTTATTMNQILGDEVVVSGGAPKGGKKPLCTRTPVSSTVDNVYLHMDWVMRLPAAWWKKKFLGQWRTPCILMTEALEYWLDPRMKRCGHVGRFPMEGVCHVSKGPIYDGEEIGTFIYEFSSCYRSARDAFQEAFLAIGMYTENNETICQFQPRLIGVHAPELSEDY